MVQTVSLDPWQEIKGIAFGGQTILSIETKFTTLNNYLPVTHCPLTIGLLQYQRDHRTQFSILGNAPSSWGVKGQNTKTCGGNHMLYCNWWYSTWGHDWGYGSTGSGSFSIGQYPTLSSQGIWKVASILPTDGTAGHTYDKDNWLDYWGIVEPYEFNTTQWMTRNLANLFSEQSYTGKVNENFRNHNPVMNTYCNANLLGGSSVSTGAFFGAHDSIDFHCWTLLNLDKINTTWLYNWREQGGITISGIVQKYRHDFWRGSTVMSHRARLWSPQTTWSARGSTNPYETREWLENNGEGMLADTGWQQPSSWTAVFQANANGYALHNPQWLLDARPPNPDNPKDEPLKFRTAPNLAEPLPFSIFL